MLIKASLKSLKTVREVQKLFICENGLRSLRTIIDKTVTKVTKPKKQKLSIFSKNTIKANHRSFFFNF